MSVIDEKGTGAPKEKNIGEQKYSHGPADSQGESLDPQGEFERRLEAILIHDAGPDVLFKLLEKVRKRDSSFGKIIEDHARRARLLVGAP
jgi:hypothetical protein